MNKEVIVLPVVCDRCGRIDKTPYWESSLCRHCLYAATRPGILPVVPGLMVA